MNAVEQAAAGRPVVASAVGGHIDNLRADAAVLVPAKVSAFVDGSRIDGAGGRRSCPYKKSLTPDRTHER
jgi:hypothetical protein